MTEPLDEQDLILTESDVMASTPSRLRTLGLLDGPSPAGVHFKQYLRRRGMTSAAVARDISVAKSTLTRWINGESELSVDLATKIQKKYKLPMDVFFNLEAAYKIYLVQQRLERDIA